MLLGGLTLAAFNTGNNLLYVVLSLLLSTLFLQNVLAEWNLRWVTLERRLPEELFAFEGGMGHLVARNTRQRFAAMGLHVREHGGQAQALFAVVPAGALGHSASILQPWAQTWPPFGPLRGFSSAAQLELGP